MNKGYSPIAKGLIWGFSVLMALVISGCTPENPVPGTSGYAYGEEARADEMSRDEDLRDEHDNRRAEEVEKEKIQLDEVIDVVIQPQPGDSYLTPIAIPAEEFNILK